MIEFRHIGLYVADLPKMEAFYANAFNMKVIRKQIETSDVLVDSIIRPGASITFSKLITPRGVATGVGDMVELIHYENNGIESQLLPVYLVGQGHIGFGVDDIESVVKAIVLFGGTLQSAIVQIGSNQCCFCTDPENNWIELIQNG